MGKRWPLEAREGREWLLSEYPLDSMPKPRVIVESWMTKKWEGKLIWYAITEKNYPIGYLCRAFVQSPNWWNFNEPNFWPWSFNRGILINHKMTNEFRTGIDNLEAVFKGKREQEVAPEIDKHAYLHNIPMGFAVGPHRSKNMRFYISRYPHCFSYRIQIHRCVLENGEYKFKHNRGCFAWSVSECPRVFKGIRKACDIIDKLFEEKEALRFG